MTFKPWFPLIQWSIVLFHSLFTKCYHRTKLNILLPYHTAIVLPGIYPKDLKTHVHATPCTWVFIAALFIIVETWKQPKCLSAGERINNLWYIQTMEYYSALKIDKLSNHEMTWKKLKCLLLSGRRQYRKATCCMIPTKRHSEKKAKLGKQ